MTIFDHFDHFFSFLIQNFSGRFDTSGSMIPRLVPEIEGGYPDRHGGGEEEGQGWGNSSKLMYKGIQYFDRSINRGIQEKQFGEINVKPKAR